VEVSPVYERDFDRRAFQVLSGSQPAESAAENDDSMFFAHAQHSPERNLAHSGIISFTVL
jgi:hypothetical protein